MSPRTAPDITMLIGAASRRSGGVFYAVQELVEQLVKHQAKVACVGLVDGASAVDSPALGEVHTFPVYGPSSFGFSPALAQFLHQYPPKLLHLHGIWSFRSIVASRLARKELCQFLVSPHGMLDDWAIRSGAVKKALAYRMYEQKALNMAACFHALTPSEARSIREFSMRNPIAVIPNGISVPQSPLKLDGPRRKLLFLGRIHKKKGIQELVRAWSQLASNPQLQDWELEVAGWDDGEMTPMLQLCRELRVPRIRFTGETSGQRKIDLLRSSNAFILPSYSEGLPMAILEAWAYRLPVFMTAACNLTEAFDAGAAIKINTDPDQIADVLSKALPSDQLLPLGEAGFQFVSEHYSWKKVLPQYLDLYNWLDHGGAPPGFVQHT